MQRASRTQRTPAPRTLLTHDTHKSLLLHAKTSSARTSTGARAPLTSPTSPCVPLLSPHARQRSAWAPVSPESPMGCSHLFLAPSSALSRLPTPRASSSPPARTPAGPHLSLQLMLGCSGHPAGLGSGRRGGKERSWLLEPPRRDARPGLCRPRGHRSVQARGQVPAPFSRPPLKFFSPGSGSSILPLQRAQAAWLSPEVGDISQDSPLRGPSDTSTADGPRPSLPSP